MWGDKYSNDLHKYDVNSKTLQKARTMGDIPDPMFQHGSTVIGENLYIFGGSYIRDNAFYSLNTIS